jgi:hypothetical protein
MLAASLYGQSDNTTIIPCKRKVIQNQQKELELQTGGYSHEVSEDDVKDYVQSVINERSSSGMSISQKAIKTDQEPSPIADSSNKFLD